MFILDNSTPYNLGPMPTFSVNAGSSAPSTVCSEKDSKCVQVEFGQTCSMCGLQSVLCVSVALPQPYLGFWKMRGTCSPNPKWKLCLYTQIRDAHACTHNLSMAHNVCVTSASATEVLWGGRPRSLEKLQPHTHTGYIRSFRVCRSNVEAIYLPLLYLHVPSQVAIALGNVNLAHMDMIKEKKKYPRD